MNSTYTARTAPHDSLPSLSLHPRSTVPPSHGLGEQDELRPQRVHGGATPKPPALPQVARAVLFFRAPAAGKELSERPGPVIPCSDALHDVRRAGQEPGGTP